MSRASTARPAQANDRPASRPATGYFQRSELPLTSLAFVIPLIVLYELGTAHSAPGIAHQSESRIIAFTFMQRFFGFFGATGRYLPALSIVGILLGCHIARNDAWQVDPRHLLGMLVESALLTIPLVGLGLAAARYLPLENMHGPGAGAVVLSVGAGIYEELVFRLIAFTLLHLLLIDFFEIKRVIAFPLIVLSSAFLFSLYHYLGNEGFQWHTLAFRTLAGFYFGIIFLFRGFGITSGTHAAYDILVLTLRPV